ncbi:MAG: S8 family serine peptidase [Anaerolineaceae bacterium]|nr:S8 family serine peptidase [Anaerolineaceae bacterium]
MSQQQRKKQVEQSDTGRYFIQFQGKSVLEAGRVSKGELQSKSAQNNIAAVRSLQARQIHEINKLLGRELNIRAQFDLVLNAASVELSPEEAELISALPGVAAVLPVNLRRLATDSGPAWVGADQIWNNPINPGLANSMGEGVVVGILDTGINFDHPSFASDPAFSGDTSSYIYPHPDHYFGVCSIPGGAYANACNDKLIGAYTYTASGSYSEPVTPEDNYGHGSHVASIAAGNRGIHVSYQGIATTINGMAPHAQIIAYDVCYKDNVNQVFCSEDDSVAAIQQAILDGVDIINYSISGGTDPYKDPVELAFRDAFAAGVFVAAAGGNQLDEPTTDGQVNHLAPWLATVAASTHDRIIAKRVSITAPANAEWQNIPLIESGPIYFAVPKVVQGKWAGLDGSIPGTNILGCSPFPTSFFTNTIALVKRGSCNFVDKVNNANAAGAKGIFIYTDSETNVFMGGLNDTLIPNATLNLGQEGLVNFENFVINEAAGLPIFSLTKRERITNPLWGDIKGDFSFRGPSALGLEVLKPELSAPGLDILAALSDGSIDADHYANSGVVTGTSMASPFVAGAAALIKSLHPSWSPAEIKSALMLTAKTENQWKEDAATPSDPFDIGSGRLQVNNAALTGLVMDESAAKMAEANPYSGGMPSTLNLASLQGNNCTGQCTWMRSFKSVSSAGITYSIQSPDWILVSPSHFSIEPGGIQILNIKAFSTGMPRENWAFAQIDLIPDLPGSPVLHLSAAAYLRDWYLYLPFISK